MFSCVDREGEEHILEYIVVVGLRLSTKGEDLKKKKKIFRGSMNCSYRSNWKNVMKDVDELNVEILFLLK